MNCAMYFRPFARIKTLSFSTVPFCTNSSCGVIWSDSCWVPYSYASACPFRFRSHSKIKLLKGSTSQGGIKSIPCLLQPELVFDVWPEVDKKFKAISAKKSWTLPNCNSPVTGLLDCVECWLNNQIIESHATKDESNVVLSATLW
jgi:hypothetical protein